ncbi:hypothetical protein [Sphingomicrobium lutaoense]|uniref:Uncharacterized protein n=1 Tax=Sphingomicrobium lutaoense TaxID=515949 RepID=A0A839Z4M1_9SPHN|nr:hypothetical protein [Sphingomicrobium lutaoense]MBB3764575.1 hypothetical protein [Sphingomicrobium lutaoense]
MQKLILGAGLLVGVPALASATGPVEEAAAAEAALKTQEKDDDANAYVCKKFPPPVGSRLGPRQICKTKANWKMLETDMQDGLRKMRNSISGQ